MMPGALFGKSWAERLFFYDAIGAQIDTPKIGMQTLQRRVVRSFSVTSCLAITST